MTDTTRANRTVLLLIGGLPVTMILLASWLWYYVASGELDIVGVLGTANQGDLLEPPLPLAESPLLDVGGSPVELFNADNSLWRILIVGSADCDEACAQRLYYTRQIRTAMGKYRPRIERVYLAPNAAAAKGLDKALLGEHPELKVLYTSQPPAFPATPAPDYFLVDPRGWVMMSYPAGADGKLIMADLKFLLKNSSS